MECSHMQDIILTAWWILCLFINSNNILYEITTISPLLHIMKCDVERLHIFSKVTLVISGLLQTFTIWDSNYYSLLLILIAQRTEVFQMSISSTYHCLQLLISKIDEFYGLPLLRIGNEYFISIALMHAIYSCTTIKIQL